MKTKLEIIEETAKYYSEDTSRRAKVNGRCVYYNSINGNMCAVGRCLKDAKYFQNNVLTEPVAGIKSIWDAAHVINYLKEDYKIDDKTFWMELQGFHDGEFNWNEDGLTNWGNEQLKYLRDSYSN